MARRFAISSAVLLLAAAVCAASGPGAVAGPVHHGQQKRATRESIEVLEEQWRKAQLSGDVAAMDSLLSDDYVGISAFGQVNTKAQQLDRVRSRSMVLSQLELSDIKVKLIGDAVAIVTSRAEIKGSSDGAPVTGTFRYTRVYQRLPGGTWKITSFEATRVPDGHDRRRGEPTGALAPAPASPPAAGNPPPKP